MSRSVMYLSTVDSVCVFARFLRGQWAGRATILHIQSLVTRRGLMWTYPWTSTWTSQVTRMFKLFDVAWACCDSMCVNACRRSRLCGSTDWSLLLSWSAGWCVLRNQHTELDLGIVRQFRRSSLVFESQCNCIRCVQWCLSLSMGWG